MKHFFPPAVSNRMQDWTRTPGAVFELLFKCWILHEKCSMMESGAENKFLPLDIKKGLPNPHGRVFHWTSRLSRNRDLRNWIYELFGIVLIISGGTLLIDSLHQGLYKPGSRCSVSGWRLVIQSFKKVAHSKTVGSSKFIPRTSIFCGLYLPVPCFEACWSLLIQSCVCPGLGSAYSSKCQQAFPLISSFLR